MEIKFHGRESVFLHHLHTGSVQPHLISSSCMVVDDAGQKQVTTIFQIETLDDMLEFVSSLSGLAFGIKLQSMVGNKGESLDTPFAPNPDSVATVEITDEEIKNIEVDENDTVAEAAYKRMQDKIITAGGLMNLLKKRMEEKGKDANDGQ